MTEEVPKIIPGSLANATPLTGVCVVQNWDDKEQCFIVIICQCWKMKDGKETISVYDTGTAETLVEAKDLASKLVEEKRWERDLYEAKRTNVNNT